MCTSLPFQALIPAIGKGIEKHASELNYVRKKKKTQNKQKRRLSFFVENN
jgi:hypothetical protein